MERPIIDPATVARLKAKMQAARDGLITDRVIVLEQAIEIVLDALEAAK